MAENSAEPTDAGQGPGSSPGSNIDTRQPSVKSLKDAIEGGGEGGGGQLTHFLRGYVCRMTQNCAP